MPNTPENNFKPVDQEKLVNEDALKKAAELLKRALETFLKGDIEQTKILISNAEKIRKNDNFPESILTEVAWYLKIWLKEDTDNDIEAISERNDKRKQTIINLIMLLDSLLRPFDEEDEYVPPHEDKTDFAADNVRLNRDFECYMERRIALAPGIEKLLDNNDFRGAVLNPYEIFMYIHSKIIELLETNPEKVMPVLDRLADEYEAMSYIYHMEHSGHAIAFREMLRELRDKNGLVFETPYADVGAGPGQMTWWLMYEGLIKRGSITMVDIDAHMIDYAKNLMELTDMENPGQHEYDFWQIDAGNFSKTAEQKGIKFNSVFSSMTLQWTKNPKKIIKSIFNSLNPGGLFVMIGEHPPNITSTTPIGIALERQRRRKMERPEGQSLYEGYIKGKPFIDIIDLCQETGFELHGFEIRELGMTTDKNKLKAAADLFTRYCEGEIERNEEVKESILVLANYHKALAMLLRKPEQ